jgi:hypothetical protein
MSNEHVTEVKKISNNEVFLPDNLKASSFTNSASISYAFGEFSLDFVCLGSMHSSVVSRVVMTPSHMKLLSHLISDSVNSYEEDNGIIALEQVK